jgi:elongation factor G
MARFVDGRYHEVDSTAGTFEIAGRGAFRELALEDAAQLLEPVMAVDVATPDIFLGAVIGDLNRRRGHIRDSFEAGGEWIVKATVPLANLIGYAEALASLTQSHARYMMRFDQYELLPGLPGDDPNFPGAAAMRAA